MNVINYSYYVNLKLQQEALSDKSRQGFGFIRTFRAGRERDNCNCMFT